MIYQCLNQLKNSQKKVEVLLGSGHSSFRGRVLSVSFDCVLLSIEYDYGDEEGLKPYEVVINLSSISSIVYPKDLQPFLSKEKEIEYEEEFKKQD